ncbi:MAG: succinate dehydrogenase, cytochrome b556 subunit [Woeseia sp.]
MNKAGRPLSPHLSIYRWPITMTLSIRHRATGVALSLGLIVLAIWLVALSTGEDPYNRISGLLGSIVGRSLLIGFSFAFFLHLCNGIRHLFWDVGLGFEMLQANASAWFVLVATIALTLGFWLVL